MFDTELSVILVTNVNLILTVTENIFRRNSLTEGGVEKIESSRIAGILGQLGQPFVQADLDKYLKSVDPKSK